MTGSTVVKEQHLAKHDYHIHNKMVGLYVIKISYFTTDNMCKPDWKKNKKKSFT